MVIHFGLFYFYALKQILKRLIKSVFVNSNKKGIMSALMFAIVLMQSTAIAQDTLKKWCNPRVEGMSKAKGVVFEQERIWNYHINTKSEELGQGEGHINLDRRSEIKFKIPIVLKKSYKVSLGFKYTQEEIHFKNIQNIDYPLFQSLEDKGLKGIGGALYFVKPTLNNKYFAVKLSGALNGDYKYKPHTYKYIKGSLYAIMGWKRNRYTSLALGIAYSYTFGEPSLYPIIGYYKTFNEKWGIEMTLPSNVKLRRNIGDKNLLFGIIELDGNAYNIHLENSAFSDIDMLELKKSEIRAVLRYEREIHNWIWFGISGGYRYNISFILSEDKKEIALFDVFEQNKKYLVKSKLDDAFFLNASIFFVAPKKLHNKYR